jgi:galactokinase
MARHPTPKALPPPPKPRVLEEIVTVLADRIIGGAVAPGDTLPSEMELTGEFGVSRTTVREALHILATRGLVQPRRRVGTVVLDRDHWNFLDPTVLERLSRSQGGAAYFRSLMDARLAIEPPIAEMAAGRATAHDAAELEAAVAAMVETLPDDVTGFGAAELRFHLALVAATHNLFLGLMASAVRVALHESAIRTVKLTLSHGRMIAGYRRVSEAVRLRQPETARAAMTSLLQTFRDEEAAEPASRRWPGPSSRLVAPPAAGLATVDTLALHRDFEALYGAVPRIVRAPGRVNLIGEHTDYNGGLALPMALEQGVWAAVGPRADRRVVLRTEVDAEAFEFSLDDHDPVPRQDWTDYVRGVAVMLERTGFWLRGANLLVRGTVPMGGGLGSSAALEVAVGHALMTNSDLPVDPLRLAQCCQWAENDFVGLRCGILDQYASCFGVAGHALLVDCRQLAATPIALPQAVRVVVCNTMVRHDLPRSAFNELRRECERGAAILSTVLPGVAMLADVRPGDLERHRALLPADTYRLCRHVVSETRRVAEAAEALSVADFGRLGALMIESHRSSRDHFGISCRELDLMVDIATAQPGCYGARLTGGGFGGCTVNLVAADALGDFLDAVGRAYHQSTGIVPSLFSCSPAAGVGSADPELALMRPYS